MLYDQLLRTIERYTQTLEQFKTAMCPAEDGSYKISKFINKVVEVCHQCNVRGNRGTAVVSFKNRETMSPKGRLASVMYSYSKRPTSNLVSVIEAAMENKEVLKDRRESQLESDSVRRVRTTTGSIETLTKPRAQSGDSPMRELRNIDMTTFSEIRKPRSRGKLRKCSRVLSKKNR